jgi:hypothetical protein
MVLAEIERHLLRVQDIVSPFLLDKLQLNKEFSSSATYIAFKVRFMIH